MAANIIKSSQFPTKAQIKDIFALLARGDAKAFYENVAEDVNWTVMGTHALSGIYNSKSSFLSMSASRIASALDGPMEMEIRSVIGGEVEEWAVIEMAAIAKCKNGELKCASYFGVAC